MNPLISCLCVTRNKPRHLQRAINCFLYQTYPAKELLIVYEDDDTATRELVLTIQNPGIRCIIIPAEPKLSLGELRNISIAEADGEYFCQWDDDDWYHRSRLEVQYNAAVANHKPGSILAFWMMYDHQSNAAFLSCIGPWAGSVMCKKSVFDNGVRYPNLKRKEDTVFLERLLKQNCLFPVVMPSLYIYSYHGGNTFGDDHFKLLYGYSQRLPVEISTLFRKIFNLEMTAEDACDMLLNEKVLSECNYFNTNFR